MRALQFITDHVIFKLPYNQIYRMKTTQVVPVILVVAVILVVPAIVVMVEEENNNYKIIVPWIIIPF